MAQHDYVIDNQTAPAFRSDLNSALSAIVTLNSGGTAPSTTYGNMLWYDSSADTLYMRSEADDAWITIGELDQTANTFSPANAVPAGAVVYLATNSAPDGWLKANGAIISRSTYSRLFSAIGTTFGVGDGSTTFALPDLRGEFLRGWDDSRGVDSGRSFGSFQSDEIRSHSHTQRGWGNGTSSGSFNSSTNEGTVRDVQSTALTGGAETRPRNIALLACIKY